MKTRFSRFTRFIALAFCVSLITSHLTSASQLSPAEQYNLILRLLAQQDNAQAFEESKQLIARAPRFDQVYYRFAFAANAANRLNEAQAFLETQLAQTPANPLAYFGLGLLYREKRDLAAAIEQYQKCLRELPDHVRTFIYLVNAWVSLRRPQEAEVFIKAVLSTQPQNAGAHFGLGFHYYQNQQLDAALPEFERALALNPQMPHAYYYKANALFRRNRFADSLETIRQAALVAKTAQDEDLLKDALSLQSNVEVRLGRYAEALDAVQQALELARKSTDLSTEGYCLGQIAFCYFRQDEYAKALQYEQQALAIHRRLKLNVRVSRNLGNMAELRYKMGDLPGALETYQQALPLAAETRDFSNQADMLMSVGGIYTSQQRFKEAAAIYEEAMRLARQMTSQPLQATGFNCLAELYAQLGDLQKALENIRQAEQLSKKIADPALTGRSLNNLGAIQLRSGEVANALQTYQEALALGESKNSPLTVWQAHTGLAFCYEKLGQPEQAREHYRKAIAVLERVRAQLGGEEEKAGFFQDKNAAYQRLIASLLAPAPANAVTVSRDQAEAFHYTERARARAFLDLLAEAKLDLEQSLAPDLLTRQQALQKQIVQLNTQVLKERALEPAKQNQAKIAELEKGLSRADAEQRDWQNEVRRRNPRYAALRYPEPLTLAETQRLLDDQTVLLAYSLGETQSFLFAVSRREMLVARLPTAARIGEHVEQLLTALTAKNQLSTAEYRRQASELSKQLIQPANRLLAGKRALIVVPDGALHRLPFEVLFTSSTAAQGDLRRLPYLVKDFAVSYAPSASVLAGLRNEPQTAAPKAFVAYADPVYTQNAGSVIASTMRAASASGRLSLNPLPHSRREAESIAKLFGDGEADLFLGAEANEENAKQPDKLAQYRLVHFSTHGYVNEARPRFSGLVLSLPPADKAEPSPGQSPEQRLEQREDGLLSAYEIFNLKLNAELVVLSACETGLGKEVKGEGLMSLMRAFMYAGTPSVLVSLWKVDDESAADLMIGFYGYQLHGAKQGKATIKLNKAEALRRAQLDAITRGDIPYYWAPFVLMGKP